MALTAPYSFQLYSARNFPPLAAQLSLLSGVGYTNVEPFGGLYGDVAGLKSVLAAADLTARSGHVALDTLENDFGTAMAIAEALGFEIVVAPYLLPDARPSDVEGWRALGERLANVAQRLGGEGLKFAWHNHDFEFVPLSDGSLPIEHLVVGDVQWEADLAWVARANADPRPWLARFSGRIPLVHVKDIAPEGENRNEDGWADVGTGVLPWPELWQQAVEAGAGIFVAEHDNPSDLERFARNSIAAMRRFSGEA